MQIFCLNIYLVALKQSMIGAKLSYNVVCLFTSNEVFIELSIFTFSSLSSWRSESINRQVSASLKWTKSRDILITFSVTWSSSAYWTKMVSLVWSNYCTIKWNTFALHFFLISDFSWSVISGTSVGTAGMSFFFLASLAMRPLGFLITKSLPSLDFLSSFLSRFLITTFSRSTTVSGFELDFFCFSTEDSGFSWSSSPT